MQQRISNGLPLIDGRKRDGFAREHIPGALNIELDSSFATYVGWLLPFNVPLLILIEDEAGRREAVVQLIRIGFEQVDGYLDGGIAAWKAAALSTTSFGTMDIEMLHKRWSQHEKLTILDVRRPDEWRAGHIPNALHIQLGDLPLRMRELPDDQTIATICHSGHRAEIAASMVAATGREVLSIRGGMEDWLKLELPSAAGSG
ncbi:MAG TPA: rhodanese-like domain-containing protein [Ktedonobacteraceae bacterium]|nr:rhodanese-like domain-containing protein [Ktedonobacteraceae bacterium]